MNPSPLRVGIWIRVSTITQAEDDSPFYHEQRARDFILKNGWQEAAVYSLLGVSGNDIMSHSETERMLEDVRCGRIKCLVFSRLDRLSRNQKHILELIEIFEDCGAYLISATEPMDTRTPHGKFMLSWTGMQAEWERSAIKERSLNSLRTRAALGKQLGGPAPFGYRWADGTLILDPQEAPIRREIYTLFLQYGKIKPVVRILNQRGYLTHRGCKFYDNTVKELLKNPIAIGTRVLNHTRSLKPRKAWTYKPPEEWITASAPALIDQDTWEACQVLLERLEGKGRQPVSLCAGLIECGGCGKKLYPSFRKGFFRCKACQRQVTTSALEGLVQYLVTTSAPRNLGSLYAYTLSKDIARLRELRHAVRKELKPLQERSASLYDLFQNQHITAEAFQKEHAVLAERIPHLETHLAELNAELTVKLQHEKMRSSATQQTEIIPDFWPLLTEHEKQALAEALIARLTLQPTGEIAVQCRLPLSS